MPPQGAVLHFALGRRLVSEFKLASPNDLKAIQLTVAGTELMNDIAAEFGAGAKGLMSSFLPVNLDSSYINLPQVRPRCGRPRQSRPSLPPSPRAVCTDRRSGGGRLGAAEQRPARYC